MDHGPLPPARGGPLKERRLHRVGRWVGWLVLALALAFLAHAGWTYRQSLAGLDLGRGTLAVLLAGVVVYAADGFLLSSAWLLLVRGLGEEAVPAAGHHRLFARSQIVKYLPGNVFHIAGRHALGRRQGVPHPVLLGATAYEILGLLLAASWIALVGYLPLGLPGEAGRERSVLVVGLMALGAAVLATWVGSRLAGRFPGLPLLHVGAARLLASVAVYSVFFLVAGLPLILLAMNLAGGVAGTALVTLTAAFAISWIAGFITPGAPAGAGVREATLVLLLAPIVGHATALALSVLLRAVTLGGDLLFFLASWLPPLATAGNAAEAGADSD